MEQQTTPHPSMG